ncbi:unnamed protein product [Oncorhynchus mykiss]|uniref:Endoplasmic reticulum-Golgi intermediate compartment protein n=1 Tax=Oncorhynchus mykiss TaxID=8022 RepID=A0A060W4B2_ONCMY|nr:unnamed protein product [Oncorhynchus mykiss]
MPTCGSRHSGPGKDYDNCGIQYEPVIFELTPQQRLWHRTLLIQNRLREELSLQESCTRGAPMALPPRLVDLPCPQGYLIYHGFQLEVINMVESGNYHLENKTPIHHPRGHAHIAAFVSHDTYDFSHRIDHVSFGEEIPGIINPLDGTEKITSNHNEMFQYFITVVPTKLHTSKVSADKHQFSVTERERVINHAAGSHGVRDLYEVRHQLSDGDGLVEEWVVCCWRSEGCGLVEEWGWVLLQV